MMLNKSGMIRLDIRFMFVLALMSVCLFGRTAAGNTNMAGWLEGQIGDWMSTNWVTPNGLALPPPGYPGNDYDVEVWAGNVTSASQDVSVASLQLQNTGTLLNITNSHSLTVRNTLNSMPSRYGMPSLNIADGTVNVLNTFSPRSICPSGGLFRRWVLGSRGGMGCHERLPVRVRHPCQCLGQSYKWRLPG